MEVYWCIYVLSTGCYVLRATVFFGIFGLGFNMYSSSYDSGETFHYPEQALCRATP